MKIVVDANIIFAALIKDSTTRALIMFLEADFYFPEDMLAEIQKYKELIKKKAGFSEEEFNTNIQKIFEYVELVPPKEIVDHIKKAQEIMADIDPKDAVVLAVAMLHKGSIIWSTDPHLKMQKIIPAVTTKELLPLYKDRYYK